MEPTTFRIMRTTLGVTQNAVADQFQVKTRTVRRWETDDSCPPAHVAEWLRTRWNAHQRLISQARAEADTNGGYITITVYTNPDQCVAETGMPKLEYESLVGHIMMDLSARNVNISLTVV